MRCASGSTRAVCVCRGRKRAEPLVLGSRKIVIAARASNRAAQPLALFHPREVAAFAPPVSEEKCAKSRAMGSSETCLSARANVRVADKSELWSPRKKICSKNSVNSHRCSRCYDRRTAMRACVTGAAGFVGRALVRRLLRGGASVRALVQPWEHADNLRAIGVELATTNLAHRDSIEEGLDDTDVVYHTPATDLEGTQNLFEACIKKGVPHVVYLSSIAIYGLPQKGEIIDENSSYDPHFDERDPDTRARIETDMYAGGIGYKTKLAVTILRPGTVFGPGKPLPVGPLGWRAAWNTNVVIGRRKQHFPLTYVENLVDAMAMVSAGRGLRKFIVIDNEDLTLGQYHVAREEIEHAPTLFLPGLPLLLAAIGFEIAMWLYPLGFGAGNKWRRIQLRLQDRRFDTRRIRETGWAPHVSLKDAIRRTLQEV